MKWITELANAGDVDALRVMLLEHNPAFDPAQLKRIAIIGAASEGYRLAGLAARNGIDVVAIADAKMIEYLNGVPRHIPAIVASHRTLAATKFGFDNIAPFALLQLLAPEQYPPHPFYDGLLKDLIDNWPRYADLYDRLADDKSRDVLDAAIGYRMTMDPAILDPVIDWDLYNPPGLIDLGTQEVYVDAGAYTGDTIGTFILRTQNQFTRIIAFEPDQENFEVLQSKHDSDPRFQLVNAGLHSWDTALYFDTGAERASRFDNGAGVRLPVVRLDSVLGGDKVTYVKMNIEGSELDALDGAAHVLKQFKPKLAISAYHRPSHLWEVPAKILELNPDYKIYLRQHDRGIVETVCYAL